MLKKVQHYIDLQNLFSHESRLVVGLSGGADSVVLLHVLCQLGYNCTAAHCNFHLRGEESMRDEQFSLSFAMSLNIPFRKIDFDTKLFASDQGISIEMAARELRYAWFEKLREEVGAEVVVVAHHQNDSVETFLLNLIRGTGIHGLTGIKPKSGHITRPFLCLTRDEILNYATQYNLSYVIDSTNLQTDYTRNFIRLDIIPRLQQINPSVHEAILKTIDNLKPVANIYDSEIQLAKSDIFDQERNRISIPLLKSYMEPQALLYEILGSYGFNSFVIKDIYDGLDGQSGKEFHSRDYLLVKDREFLIIEEKENLQSPESFEINKNDELLHYPVPMSMSFFKNENEFKIMKNRRIAYFDAEKLEFPLLLRHWRKGDSFIPFGMSGTRKLSDYFSDKKYNRIDKEKAWILCSGDNIIWIVGERTDNKYRITESTREIYCINLF